jgi:Mitochondrial degradasome RNA helicase subunit C terminal/Suv3 C-terminal domain 1
MVFFDTSKLTRYGSSKSLTVSEVRQIGGRAGRYRTSHHDTNTMSAIDDKSKSIEMNNPLQEGSTSHEGTDKSDYETVADITDGIPLDSSNSAASPAVSTIGYVTALNEKNLEFVRRNMSLEPEPIHRAGLKPTAEVVERFYGYFPPGIPYSFILAQLYDMSRVSSSYFIADVGDQMDIADAIELVKDLGIKDRITMCFAPAGKKEPLLMMLLHEMACCVANQSGGNLLDLKSLNIEVLDLPPTPKMLEQLEVLHKCLVLYCWMSFRFPGVFNDRIMAKEAKLMTEEAINTALATISSSDPHHFIHKIVLNFGSTDADGTPSSPISRKSSKYLGPRVSAVPPFASSSARENPLLRRYSVPEPVLSKVISRKVTSKIVRGTFSSRAFSTNAHAMTYFDQDNADDGSLKGACRLITKHSVRDQIVRKNSTDSLTSVPRSQTALHESQIQSVRGPTNKRVVRGQMFREHFASPQRSVTRPQNILSKTEVKQPINQTDKRLVIHKIINRKTTSGDVRVRIKPPTQKTLRVCKIIFRSNSVRIRKHIAPSKTPSKRQRDRQVSVPSSNLLSEQKDKIKKTVLTRVWRGSSSIIRKYGIREWEEVDRGTTIVRPFLDFPRRGRLVKRILDSRLSNSRAEEVNQNATPAIQSYATDHIHTTSPFTNDDMDRLLKLVAKSDRRTSSFEPRHAEGLTTNHIRTTSTFANDDLDRLLELATKSGHRWRGVPKKGPHSPKLGSPFSMLSEDELSALARLRNSKSQLTLGKK